MEELARILSGKQEQPPIFESCGIDKPVSVAAYPPDWKK
jgi:hypothetical protein